MFSPIKAAIAGALVFALGGLALSIQPLGVQDSSPAAAPTGPASAPSFFTGEVANTMGWTSIGESATERREDEIVDTSGVGYTFPWSTSDPRVSGTATVVVNETDYRFAPDALAPTGDAGVIRTGSLRISNEEGSWDGPITILQLASPSWEHGSGWLTGSGAYDGLSVYFVLENNETIHGHVTAEGPPPEPELPAAE